MSALGRHAGVVDADVGQVSGPSLQLAPSGTASAKWSRPRCAASGGPSCGGALVSTTTKLPGLVSQRHVADVRIVREGDETENGAVPLRTGADVGHEELHVREPGDGRTLNGVIGCGHVEEA